MSSPAKPTRRIMCCLMRRTPNMNDVDADLYTASILQKQGYYSYQYLWEDEHGKKRVLPSEGNFYQTENRYQALVYYKETGGRTWRLAAFGQITLN